MTTQLPADVVTELTRLVRRWHQLPVDRALLRSGSVRETIERYAGLRHPGAAVPDLGPAALPDQLTVVVYDALVAGCVDAHAVGADLVALRHTVG